MKSQKWTQITTGVGRLLAGLVFLGLLAQCESPVTFNNESRKFVEAGLSELRVASVSFQEGGKTKTTVASGTLVTVTLDLINPKEVDAAFSLSWNLDNDHFTTLPPVSPAESSPDSLSFSFVLGTKAERKDLVFTLGLSVPSTGKTYPNDQFQVRCDSPPSPVGNATIGKDGAQKSFLAFTLPESVTDNDLASVILTYQDIQDPVNPGPATTITLGVENGGPLTTVSTPDILSSVTALYKRYFMPAVTALHAYAFQATLVDLSGQTSTVVTVGAAGINYSLTYSANGGTGTAATQTVPYGTVLPIDDASGFAQSGSYFDHWNTQPDGSGDIYYPNGSITMNQGNVILYARWLPLLYLVYDANGGVGTPPTDPTGYQPNDIATVMTSSGLTKSGFAFTEWNTMADGSGTTYLPGSSFTMTAQGMLYAIWTAYTVTYNDGGAAGGSVPAGTISYPANSTITVLGNSGNLAGANIIFQGWSTGPSGTGTAYVAGDTFTLTGNVTLYPTWFTVSGSTITASMGNTPHVVLPTGVTSVAANVFAGNTALISISMPDVVSLDANTFQGCTSLTTVSMPSVTDIGFYTFQGCTSLTSVTMPSVTTIANQAFNGCSGLTTISLPATLTSLGTQAFLNCSNLASITSSSSAYPVVNGMLLNSTQTSLLLVPAKLNGTLSIPSTVNSISSYALGNCTNLTSITIPSAMTSIGSNAFSGLASPITVTIPSTVTSIGAYAFTYASGMVGVTVPATVTSIGDSAFYGCIALANVTMAGGSPPTLGTTVFDGTNGALTIHVPDAAAVTAYQAAANWSTYSAKITTP